MSGQGDPNPFVAETTGLHPADRVGPEPVAFRPWVCFRKEEVFEMCGALALAEVLLDHLGQPVDAARMAAVFELLEAGLVR